MVRYFYSWMPLIIVVAVFPLALPWLGLIALMIAVPVVLGALGALVWAIFALPYLLGRAITRRLQGGLEAG